MISLIPILLNQESFHEIINEDILFIIIIIQLFLYSIK